MMQKVSWMWPHAASVHSLGDACYSQLVGHQDQNAQLVELIMFFKVRCTTPASPCLTQHHSSTIKLETARVIKDWQSF